MNETRVGIAELKAHLSQYVSRARAGERIIVCDRNVPAAELSALKTVRGLEPATRPVASIRGLSGVPAKNPVDVVALLSEDRGER